MPPTKAKETERERERERGTSTRWEWMAVDGRREAWARQSRVTGEGNVTPYGPSTAAARKGPCSLHSCTLVQQVERCLFCLFCKVRQ